MKRLPIALIALTALTGCSIFGGHGDKRPKTPVLGDRLPVLTSETGAEVDPALSDQPVTVPPDQVNADWPQPGGNVAKTIGPVALGTALSQAWSTHIAGGNNRTRLAASPVVAQGRIYVVDTNATVHAFSADGGRPVWTANLGVRNHERSSEFGGGVSFDNGKVFAVNGLGDIAALDAASGKILWKVRPAGPMRGSPTIANGNVYVLSQDNQIYALSAESGKTQWNEAATLETASVFGVGSPAFAQGTVVAGFSSGELTAFRYENGRAVWQDALSRTSISTSVSTLSDIDASPIVDAGRVYAIGAGGRMVALDLITGQRLWELNISGISTPTLAGDWLFVVTDDAKLLCIARNTGKVRWMTQLQRWRKQKNKSGQITWTGPVLAGGRLILANSVGQLVNVSLDGKIGNKGKVGDPVSLPPVVANNTLYILTNKGRLSAWK
jgi:outer membrane protein assembly factor BamB